MLDINKVTPLEVGFILSNPNYFEQTDNHVYFTQYFSDHFIDDYNSVSFIAVDHKKNVVAAFGLMIQSPRVGDLWLTSNMYLKGYTLSFVKQTKLLLDFYMRKFQLIRLTALVSSKVYKDHKRNLIDLYGLVKEGFCPKFFMDEDHYIYGRIIHGVC